MANCNSIHALSERNYKSTDTSDNELFKNFLRFQTYIICASTYFLDSPVGPVRHQISPDKDRKSLSNKLTTLNPSYLASTEMTAKPDSYRRVPENISCYNGQGFLLTTYVVDYGVNCINQFRISYFSSANLKKLPGYQRYQQISPTCRLVRNCGK